MAAVGDLVARFEKLHQRSSSKPLATGRPPRGEPLKRASSCSSLLPQTAAPTSVKVGSERLDLTSAACARKNHPLAATFARWWRSWQRAVSQQTQRQPSSEVASTTESQHSSLRGIRSPLAHHRFQVRSPRLRRSPRTPEGARNSFEHLAAWNRGHTAMDSTCSTTVRGMDSSRSQSTGTTTPLKFSSRRPPSAGSGPSGAPQLARNEHHSSRQASEYTQPAQFLEKHANHHEKHVNSSHITHNHHTEPSQFHMNHNTSTHHTTEATSSRQRPDSTSRPSIPRLTTLQLSSLGTTDISSLTLPPTSSHVPDDDDETVTHTSATERSSECPETSGDSRMAALCQQIEALQARNFHLQEELARTAAERDALKVCLRVPRSSANTPLQTHRSAREVHGPQHFHIADDGLLSARSEFPPQTPTYTEWLVDAANQGERDESNQSVRELIASLEAVEEELQNSELARSTAEAEKAWHQSRYEELHRRFELLQSDLRVNKRDAATQHESYARVASMKDSTALQRALLTANRYRLCSQVEAASEKNDLLKESLPEKVLEAMPTLLTQYDDLLFLCRRYTTESARDFLRTRRSEFLLQQRLEVS